MIRQVVGVLAILCLALPLDAAAQGRGQPKRPKVAASLDAAPPATSGGVSVTSPRQFGVWLDDATGPDAGGGTFGLGFGYWRSSAAALVDVPIIDVSYGVTNRVQFAASVPFYRASYNGASSSGLDDVYLSGKIVAVDASSSRSGAGVAISPVIEILSAGYADDRVHWALPVSVEVRRSPVRFYGATGYFSRGAVFGAGALEWSTPGGPIVTGALTHTRSTVDDLTGADRGRTDVAATLAHPFTSVALGYVSVGRSLTSAADGGTTLGISAGVSFRFSPPSSTP